MNRLLKYILFVNIIFIVFFGIGTLVDVLYKNYINAQRQQVLEAYENYKNTGIYEVDSEGKPVPQVVPTGPLYTLRRIFSYLFLFVIPLLIIITSGFYQYTNPTIRNYAKSLLIPLSYIFIAFFLTMLWGKIVGIHGEEGMIFLFFYMQFAITFFAVAIINFMVFLFKRA